MWIYALGVTLRQTLQSAAARHTPGTFDNIIMDNQQQPVDRRRRCSDRSSGSKEQLSEGDYHQSDRTEKTDSSSINCRGRYSAHLASGWDIGNDSRTNGAGEWIRTWEKNRDCNKNPEVTPFYYLLFFSPFSKVRAVPTHLPWSLLLIRCAIGAWSFGPVWCTCWMWVPKFIYCLSPTHTWKWNVCRSSFRQLHSNWLSSHVEVEVHVKVECCCCLACTYRTKR